MRRLRWMGAIGKSLVGEVVGLGMQRQRPTWLQYRTTTLSGQWAFQQKGGVTVEWWVSAALKVVMSAWFWS